MGAENGGCPIRYFIEFIDKNCSVFDQFCNDVRIMDDLVTNVNGGPQRIYDATNYVDRSLDARTKAARIRKDDTHYASPILGGPNGSKSD
jgi:hypothetical protein